jgi:histidyl-tRNA synthetase
MQAQALPGFRDFYPPEAALRNHIFAVWREVAARYGFQEYDGPPLEPLELYTEKSGDEIVAQLYHFEDKGGRQVALRPEMTPTLARMVAARVRGLKKPIRWFSLPQLFRYERQQRGRLREHFQLNMDILGEPGPLADAEIIAAAVDILRSLGFGPDAIRVRLSDRRVVQALLADAGVTADQLPLAYAAIDKVEREPRAVLADRLGAAGFSASAVERALDIGGLRGRAAVESALSAVRGGEDTGEPLLACASALEAMDLGAFVEFDLSIVRGLAYYTGVVFELFDTGKSLRAICGGGRYDRLLASVSSADLPAVGFGMGDVVLTELLRERGLLPAGGASSDTFIIAMSDADRPLLLKLAQSLRALGESVLYALTPATVGKQLKEADARGAARVILLGPEEVARGAAIVRIMSTGEQREVALDEIMTGASGSQS